MSDNVTKGVDEKFCSSCGAVIKMAAEICPKCGVRQKAAMSSGGDANASPKSRTTTLLLCIFLGGFGAHRFYTGRPGLGILQIVTLCGLCVWWILDFIFILTGSLKDVEGKRVLNW